MAESRSNTELVRGSYDAFNQGERDGEIERYWHPDLVFHELPYAPDSGTYRGYDGLLTGRGHDSGIEIDLRFFSVFELREGKLATHTGFMERDQAARAAGTGEA